MAQEKINTGMEIVQFVQDETMKKALTTLLLAAAAAFPLTLAAESSAGGLDKVVIDAFNPDVTSEMRENPQPQRGGRLRLRNIAEFDHLNVLTTTAAPSRVVLNHLTDSLVNRDLETMEFYGEMAWHWREFDLVRLEGGEVQEGIIQGDPDNEETFTFIPGAWRGSWNLFDVAEIGENHIVLSQEWGGEKIEGAVTRRELTVSVDTSHAPGHGEPVTIQTTDLDIYTVAHGSREESLPFAKVNSGFEFHIRPNIKWHNGEPFTAHDVVFSFETIMNPHVDAQPMRSLYSEVEMVEASEDGSVVRFHYRQPFFQALAITGGESAELGMSYFIPKSVFDPDQFGGDEVAFGEAFNDHPFKDAPVYTGPYRFKEHRRGESLTVERNPNYWKNELPDGAVPNWRKGQPWMDEISWVLYREASTAIRDLGAGRLDADLEVEPANWAQRETNTPEFLANVIRAKHIGFLYTYIGWNLEREIFQDADVRRALAMLIPREEIARNVHYDLAFPVDGPFYFNSPAYNHEVEAIPYDPRGAIRLLGRAGWRDRTGDGIREKEIDGRMVRLEFEYAIHNARDYHQKIADIIKESLEQAGIRVNISRTEWAIFLRKAREKNFDAIRLAWNANMDPDPFINWHSSQSEGGGNNTVSFHNERVDELTVALRRTMDQEKRWAIAREIHSIIAEEQPYCFLFGFHQTYFISRNLRGVKLYPSGYPLNFSEWWWATPAGTTR